MLKKVVVGTDFSDPSAAVLDFLPRLSHAGLEAVTLVHVTHPVSLGIEQAALAGARESLDRQAERLRESDIQVETRVEHGSTAVVLADVARQEGADALVVGSHGRSLLGRILLGSVSMALLHQSQVPVLIVRIDLCRTDEGISCELQPGRPFEHVLFPTDFSEAADHAFERTRELVGATASRVTLLHVHNPPAYDEDEDAVEIETLHSQDRERMEQMAAELRDGGVANVEVVVTTGAPAVSAVRLAESHGASLIAMGTQGRGEIEELVVGSVALKVARTSPVPVLMIPRPR